MDTAKGIVMKTLDLPASLYGKADLDEGKATQTSYMQTATERECGKFLGDSPASGCEELFFGEDMTRPKLIRPKHLAYLFSGMFELPQQYSSLDASRPWLAYWIYNAMDFLGHRRPVQEQNSLVDFIGSRCQSSLGGFCGGPDQLAHLAPTYASVLALCTIGTPAALGCIRRGLLYRYLLSLKSPCGGFAMHADGEIDVRAVYIALCVADLTGILTPELARGTRQFVASCQSHEGGFAGEPGCEPHGGYNFCAVAALKILGAWEDGRVDARQHARWLASKQMVLAGGFQGRSHKLVDGCYSFWQGGAFGVSQEAPTAKGFRSCRAAGAGVRRAIGRALRRRRRRRRQGCDGTGASQGAGTAERAPTSGSFWDSGAGAGAGAGVAAPMPRSFCDGADAQSLPTIRPMETEAPPDEGLAMATASTGASIEHLLRRDRLQQYILRCCQQPNGGLRDKPSKRRDHYHTLYCLMGLASSQWDTGLGDREPRHAGVLGGEGEAEAEAPPVGPSTSAGNRLPAPDQAAGIRWDRADAARRWFRREGGGPSDHAGLHALAAEEVPAARAATVQSFLEQGSPLLPVAQGGDGRLWWQGVEGSSAEGGSAGEFADGRGGQPDALDAADAVQGFVAAGAQFSEEEDEEEFGPGSLLYVPEGDDGEEEEGGQPQVGGVD